jgi:2-oxoglutarate dehydrogenase complex dehydrogenase (E1) component-like enzyme
MTGDLKSPAKRTTAPGPEKARSVDTDVAKAAEVPTQEANGKDVVTPAAATQGL